MQPLTGIKVLDFSTLLPGPMATLVLGEAGAEVIKLERPGRGDEMRSYVPRFGPDSVNFALLNRGKQSLAVDLKSAEEVARLRPLIEEADILVEQFRPGVMDRLGLGYETLREINPRLIYCSITGYGQTGPKAAVAAHDLNYIAETGMLGLSAGADGAPVLPPALIADIAGGTYPAIINILLALRQRDQTGTGCRLDIAMTDNLFTFMYWALGNGLAAGQWPRPGAELVTGGSPRYRIYRTADGRYLAAAPLEEKFWQTFCEAIDLPATLRDDSLDPAATTAAVAELIGQRSSDDWQRILAGKEVCCSIVATLQEAMADPQFAERGLFRHQVQAPSGGSTTALPMPLDPQFRTVPNSEPYPLLGESNRELEAKVCAR